MSITFTLWKELIIEAKRLYVTFVVTTTLRLYIKMRNFVRSNVMSSFYLGLKKTAHLAVVFMNTTDFKPIGILLTFRFKEIIGWRASTRLHPPAHTRRPHQMYIDNSKEVCSALRCTSGVNGKSGLQPSCPWRYAHIPTYYSTYVQPYMSIIWLYTVLILALMCDS